MQIISAHQIDEALNWERAIEAIRRAHLGVRPVADGFYIGDAQFGLLGRGVILPGQGAGFKLSSICPGNSLLNPPTPAENAAFAVIDEKTKAISAILDGPAITRWKTPADSVLAARLLSREDSAVLLVLGAGPIAKALIEAYLHIRPSIQQVLLWNRTKSKLSDLASGLAARGIAYSIVDDLNEAVSRADIITSATSATAPLIPGKFIQEGAHIDLLGGFRPDMQEADSETFRRARIFVDDVSNALLSGDLQSPIKEGVINESSIEGDLYDLCQAGNVERNRQEITVYKNAGGAHIDLAVCQSVINASR